jgi:hypothetical protein
MMLTAVLGLLAVGWSEALPMEAVTALAEEDFDSFVEENQIVLVNFYGQTIEDDKTTNNESAVLELYFQQAAAKAKAEGLTAVFASIDIDKAEDLSAQYDLVLERKPLVRLFRYGRMDESHYDNFNPWADAATPDNLLAFARTKSVYPLDIIDSEDDLRIFKLEDKVR